MSEAPMLVRLDQLRPHPDNPRLVIRQEVVDGIAASLATEGFSRRYALTVRPHQGGYQILAGHHRKLAAEKAGLAEVPCWVVDFDDERANDELIESNRHGELHPLEEGQHALKSGMTVRGYAEKHHKRFHGGGRRPSRDSLRSSPSRHGGERCFATPTTSTATGPSPAPIMPRSSCRWN